MVNTLVKARREGTLAAKLRTLTAPSVLVIDDVGNLPIERGGAGAFFHVVNTRYERGHPTIITTNRGLPEWGEIFGDPVVAAAILDDSCTRPSSSTSKDRPGACVSTRLSRVPPPTPKRAQKRRRS